MSEADNQAAVEAPGAALAAARQAQNLSVADVAHQLKLSVSQIEALEAGASGKLPGPIFVRGFIRNYARLLKLDPEVLLRSAEASLPPLPPGEEKPPSQDIPFPAAETQRWPVYAGVLLLLIGGLVGYEFYWNEPGPTAAKIPSAPGVAAPGLPAAPPAPSTAEPAQAASPASSVSAADKPAAPAAPDESQHPKPGERQLQFVFDEDSWVEVRGASGRIIFSQLNRAGSKQRVYGRPPLSLIVGNAHGVRLTYNDEAVDLKRHTQIDVARFTLE